jgi:hypothetical protein
MARITATKLARAKFRAGSKVMYGKKVAVQRIVGYEPAEPRNIVRHPKHPELTVLASPGQRINFGREAYRKGLTHKKR